MSIPLYSELDDDLSKYGSLVSVEAFQGVSNALNYLIDAMPIGSIVPILKGFPGVPEPDLRLWKLCDGSMITEQRSDLHDTYAPDMRDKYVKGGDSGAEAGQVAGWNQRSFAHNHGGQTQYNPTGNDNADTDDDYITIYSHTHPIYMGLSQNMNVEPLNFSVLHYIKIA